MDETTRPLISFIVPVAPAWAPYVERMLRSLTWQTDQCFDVVFGVDGGDPDGALAEVFAKSWPFEIVAVDSARPDGDFPHRNHARNAAIRASTGTYLWVVDCDFIWSEVATAHAAALIRAAAADGELIAATPVLKRIVLDEDLYLPHTEPWAVGEEHAPPSHMVAKLKTDDGEWSGQAGLYNPDNGPQIASGRPEEGFPLAPRAVFDALDLFDERFVRWGGNKIELCYRLSSLTSVGLEYQILTSVAAWHQPHPQDPNKPLNDPHRQANHSLYRKRMGEVRGGADWWIKQRNAVNRVVLDARLPADSLPAGDVDARHEGPAITVGLVTVADTRKGIARDIVLIEQALRSGPVRRRGKPDPAIARYTLESPHAFIRGAGPSLEGEAWDAFLERVDVVVFSEIMPTRAINQALAAEVRVVYLPNADWAEIGGDVDHWIRITRALTDRGVVVLSKSAGFSAALALKGLPSTDIAWTDLGPIRSTYTEPEPDSPVRFYASIGMGGYKSRRRVETIVSAWHLAELGDVATLTIKSARPLVEVVEGLDLAGIEVIEEDWTRAQIEAAWSCYDVVLYPTAWDGFGLSVAEALNAGCPVLATDVWPINEQVVDGHNGILLETQSAGHMRLAPIGEVSPEALADAMARMVEPGAARALSVPQPAERHLLQRAMVSDLRTAILDEPVASVLVVTGTGATTAGGRRSELWWCDALRSAGFKVHVLTDREVHVADTGLAVDFAIVGKAAPADVTRVRALVGADAPVVCWHLDLTDYTERREAWQRQMLKACDLCLVSEGDLDRFTGDGEIRFMPAAQEIAPRRGEVELEPMVSPIRMAFLGNCHGVGDPRASEIKGYTAALAGEGIALDVWGEPKGWKAAGVQVRGQAHGEKAGEVYRGRFALCISRTTDRAGYTSNRLFSAMAGGAIPVVKRFKGIADVIDPNAAIIFDDLPGMVEQVKALALDPAAMAAMRRRAFESVWRSGTWGNRVLDLLGGGLERRATVDVGTPLGAAFQAMWQARGKRMGRRAVGHVAWSDEVFEQRTRVWWKKFKRHLTSRLKSGMRLLDYGCGVGRFTKRIADETVALPTGVDIAPSMLAMARESAPQLDFRLLRAGEPLPFADDSFDALFTCTVLQHVPDDELPKLIAELRRVLRPNAVIFLFENCHRARVRSSHSGHVVFRDEREYRTIFPGIIEIESWFVEGEKHAIIAGRVSAG